MTDLLASGAKVIQAALLPLRMDSQHPGPLASLHWGLGDRDTPTTAAIGRGPVSPEHNCQQFKSVTRLKTMAPDILTGMNKYESWHVEMNFICFKPFETKLWR